MSLRRFVFPLRLVGSRLSAGGERLLLVSLGVVAGAAVLAAVLGGKLVMQDRSLAQATAQLQPADREVQVTWSGAVNSFSRLNAEVVPQLRRVTGTEPADAMLFRESSIQERLVNLRAADDLGRYVRLVSGRLPTRCTPAHCEVLRLKGAGPIPSTPALRLILVGRAELEPDAPIAPFVLPAPRTEMVAQAVRYHTPQPSPIVIANGIAGLSRTTELETFYRSYAWFVPVLGGDIHPWSVGAFSARVQRISAQLEASSDEFQVTAPTDTLAAAAASSTAAGSSAAAARRRRRRAAARVHGARGRGDAARRRRRATPARLVRRDALAGRAVHARRVRRAVALSARSSAGCVGGGVAAVVASRAGSPAWPVVDALPALARRAARRRAASPRSPALLLYAAVRAPARAVRPARPDAARRRRARCGRDRGRRLGARLGRRARARVGQRHERLRPARSRADRLRGRGDRRPAARAGAARARAHRPPRADRDPARRRSRSREIPGTRRSPRRSSSRASASRCSRSRTARR